MVYVHETCHVSFEIIANRVQSSADLCRYVVCRIVVEHDYDSEVKDICLRPLTDAQTGFHEWVLM